MNREKYNRIVKFLNKDIGPKRIDSRTMSLFLNELSLLLNSGISLYDSLSIIKRQGANKKIEKAINIILYNLERGRSPYEAFKMAEGYFSDLILAFVKTGTKTGKLAGILENLSNFIYEESKNRSAVKQAMTYPLIVLFVSVFVIITIINFVMPSFIEIFDQSEMSLPLMTRMLLGISNFFAENSLLLLLVIGLIFLIILVLRTNYQKKIRMDEFLFKLKPIHKLNRLRVEYQLTSIYYILKSGDIDTIETFLILADSYKNAYIKEVILKIKDDINKGDSLSLAFRKAEIFSPLLLSMVDIGTETSKLDETMKKANEFFATEYIFRIRKISSIAEPLMILLMGLLVAFVVFSVSIPMFDSINGISGV